MAKTINPWPFPPIYDALYDEPIPPSGDSNLNSEWLNFFQSITNTLTTNFSPTGYTVPAIDNNTAGQIQADQIQSFAYNSDENVMQVNNNGIWENILTMIPVTTQEFNDFEPIEDNRFHLVYNIETNEIFLILGSLKLKFTTVIV